MSSAKLEPSGSFIQMVQLSYKKFIHMIEELNELAQYFIDNDGSSLQFNIIKGTDSTFLWKITVRIECSKFSNEATDIRGCRILRLNQFINLYNSIKQQADTMKYFSDTASNLNTNDLLNNSRLYDSISIPNGGSSSKEDDLCCICMERKPNLILPCTHNYCESCIQEWQVTNTTCPICRCVCSKDDSFVLADKPDYYHLQDEMSKSLFQITDRPKRNIKNHNSSRNSSFSD